MKDGCYNLLLAAACPWPDRTAQLSDISSGATWVADLDSGALALTKEASGNSRDPVGSLNTDPVGTVLTLTH